VPIVSDRPETGLRLDVERSKAEVLPPWIYRGFVHTPERSYPVEVSVQADGSVTVRVDAVGADAAPAAVDEKVRLILRAAYKQAAADEEPPAWRIVRWRGEK
jgi:hypothetical protein